jgi:hypothetical protein
MQGVLLRVTLCVPVANLLQSGLEALRAIAEDACASSI